MNYDVDKGAVSSQECYKQGKPYSGFRLGMSLSALGVKKVTQGFSCNNKSDICIVFFVDVRTHHAAVRERRR